MKPPLIAAILSFAAISISPQIQAPAPSGPNTYITDGEYEVLSAYITETFVGSRGENRVGTRVAKIVVQNKTQSDQEDHLIEDENGKPIPWSKIRRLLRKQSPVLQQSTLNSFRDVNAHPAPLRPRFQLSLPYELVDGAEIRAIFENNGWWTDYYKKYSDSQGFLTVSRIGFSADGKQAMFYSANACGGKCGSGTYVVMQKIGATWRVVKEVLMWVS